MFQLGGIKMKRIICTAAITAITASVAIADMNESRVTFTSGGQEVVGTLNVPEGAPAPVVLLFHGFTGARDELKSEFVKAGVFAHTAAKLAEAGYASLRIDFRGSGESTADLNFAQTTFEGQIADGLSAMEYIKFNEAVDGDDMHIIGWSQGGLIAAAVAGRSNSLDSVALWNAVADAKGTYGGLLSDEVLKVGMGAAADQPVNAKLPWGAEITLNGAFFDEVETLNPIIEIRNYSGPLFVAQGTNDTVVAPRSADAYIQAHEGAEMLWTAEMDHAFNVFTTDETLNQMIDETVSFFNANAD